MLSQKSSLCRAGSFLSADYIRDVSCKCAKATHKNARVRFCAFVSILSCDTWLLRLCIAENAANATMEEAYLATRADLCRRFEETEARLTSLQKQRDRMKAEAISIGGMMFELGELDALPVDFDEKLWNGTIDHVTVHADERVVFCFKDGKEIITRL